jgi:hypothetical protein
MLVFPCHTSLIRFPVVPQRGNHCARGS